MAPAASLLHGLPWADGSLADALRSNQRLLKLSLEGTRMSSSGVAKIQAALNTNNHHQTDPKRRVRGIRSVSISARDTLVYNCKFEQNDGYCHDGAAVPGSLVHG